MSIPLFFVIAFGWSWTFWGIPAVTGASIASGAGMTLFYLGLLGPVVAGITIVYRRGDRVAIADYWMRVIEVKRIGVGGLLTIVLFFPAIMLAALAIDQAVFGEPALHGARERFDAALFSQASVVGLLAGVMLRGPLPEELGWRGAVLDLLQARYGFAISSVLLGGLWAAWHLPLFFLKGMLHQTNGVGSLWFWEFVAQVVCLSVVFSWLYNRTRRSTLGAILAHFCVNLSMIIGDVTEITNATATFLLLAIAVAVLASRPRCCAVPMTRAER